MPEPTYRVLMFTPYFPGTRQDFEGLSFEEADAKAANWIVNLQAEGYQFITYAKNQPRKNYIFDGYRPAQPTWVRIRIVKE
jgi:hypothetical protein